MLTAATPHSNVNSAFQLPRESSFIIYKTNGEVKYDNRFRKAKSKGYHERKCRTCLGNDCLHCHPIGELQISFFFRTIIPCSCTKNTSAAFLISSFLVKSFSDLNLVVHRAKRSLIRFLLHIHHPCHIPQGVDA